MLERSSLIRLSASTNTSFGLNPAISFSSTPAKGGAVDFRFEQGSEHGEREVFKESRSAPDIALAEAAGSHFGVLIYARARSRHPDSLGRCNFDFLFGLAGASHVLERGAKLTMVLLPLPLGEGTVEGRRRIHPATLF